MATTRSADRQRHWRKLIERQQAQRAEHCGFLYPGEAEPGHIPCVEAAAFGGQA